jgi:hypothetical protein
MTVAMQLKEIEAPHVHKVRTAALWASAIILAVVIWIYVDRIDVNMPSPSTLPLPEMSLACDLSSYGSRDLLHRPSDVFHAFHLLFEVSDRCWYVCTPHRTCGPGN